jgi:hypothetical protein
MKHIHHWLLPSPDFDSNIIIGTCIRGRCKEVKEFEAFMEWPKSWYLRDENGERLLMKERNLVQV